MEEHEVISNTEKYNNYKIQHNKLKKAMANQFYLEAIFIEYAIIEDRFESILKHGGRWKEPKKGDYVSINRKITLVKKMTEEKKGLARKYFSDDLIGGIEDWKDKRNTLIHALLKRNTDIEYMRQLAEEGSQYARALSNKATSFKRAIEKRKTPK